MLGLLGDTVIGLDHLTSATEQSDRARSRLVRHETVRGKPILQDMGDDNSTRSLRFFLDETFCDVEAELDRVQAARRSRSVLRLLLGQQNLVFGGYVIEEIEVVQRKTSPTGRIVRADMIVELVEAAGGVSGLLGGVAGTLATAFNSPFLRR